MKQKFFYKISNKITFYFAILFSIIIAIIFLHFFFDIQEKEINHIKSQLNSIIKFSVPLIDGNYHSLISSANENDHYYNNISEVLRLVKDNNHKILDIYTVIFSNDDILIGVNIDESKNWGDAYQYKDLLPMDKFPIIGIPNSNSTDIFFGAETILFGVSPIYDNFGNLQAFLIIEFDTEQLQVNKRIISQTILFFSLLLLPIVIYLSGFFAKNLTKPINELVNGSQRIKEGNFNQPVLILSNDEFQTLGDIFNNMMEKLKMTMINLQKEVDNISKAHIRQKATYNISQAIITSTNLDELYSKIHAIISEVIYAENFYIALIGENTHTIDFVYFVDQFDKEPNYSTMKEKSLTALAINCSKSKILSKNQIENFEKENLIINYGTLPEEWLGIPLKIEDRTIGIMVTQSYSDLFFTEEDVDFLEYVSEQIAISIKRKKYEEEIFNSNQSYFKLFNESPTAYIDLSYIKLIRYLEQNQIEFDAASLEDELFNNSNKFKKLFELIEINQINKQLLELFCVKNKKELLENFSNSTNLKSILKVINNIIKNTNLEDVCEFYDFQNNQKYLSVKWSNISVYENEKIFYRSIVSFTDITKQRLYEAQLNYESTHDSLTGLYNRTYLDKASKRLKHKNLSPFSLIMVDIDDLKLINDNMGHMKGDNVIRNIADLLMQSFREDDIVVRFGGDEFLILLPNTDKKSMDIAVNRIQKNLKKLNEKDQDVNINLSIGCSTQYGELMIEELIKSADDSMYLVKKNKKTIR